MQSLWLLAFGLLLPAYTVAKEESEFEGLRPRARYILEVSKLKQKQSDFYAEYYGAAILGYVALICLLRTFSNFVYKAAPSFLRKLDSRVCRKVRKHTMLPATFGTKHSNPHYVTGFSFNIPTREQTLILVGYVILNIVFMCVSYQTFDFPPDSYRIIPPDLWGHLNRKKYLQKQICNRAGILAVSQFPLLILFAGRNNFLLLLTGWSLDAFNVFHKWFGRIIVILLFIHAVAYTIYLDHDIYISMWAESFWRWGVVAFVCSSVIVFQSLHYFRALRYEIFLVFHTLLAVFFTVGAWYHLKDQFFYQYVYAAIAVWAFDRALRICRILFSGLNSKADVRYHDGGVMELNIKYSRFWKPYPGAYAFIHFLKWNRFWQNHPFTIIQSPKPEDDGKLVIFIRVKSGITKRTKHYVRSCEDSIKTIRLFVDGPYGCSYPVHKYDNIFMFAGGIGITAVYSYALALKNRSVRDNRVYIHWVIPDVRPLGWFADYLSHLQTDDRFHIRVHISNEREVEPQLAHEKRDTFESITLDNLDKSYGRLNVYDMAAEYLHSCKGSSAFLVCGPGPMNDDVRKAISKNIEHAPDRVDYFEESFSW
jgi:predicted ferric reductase